MKQGASLLIVVVLALACVGSCDRGCAHFATMIHQSKAVMASREARFEDVLNPHVSGGGDRRRVDRRNL
jgi:hypothetical protein